MVSNSSGFFAARSLKEALIAKTVLMDIFKEFVFDAAHFNPVVSKAHRCSSIDGHRYHVTVYLEGEPDRKAGCVRDFEDSKVAMGRVLNHL